MQNVDFSIYWSALFCYGPKVLVYDDHDCISICHCCIKTVLKVLSLYVIIFTSKSLAKRGLSYLLSTQSVGLRRPRLHYFSYESIFFRATDICHCCIKTVLKVLSLYVIIFTSKSLAKRGLSYFTMDPKCWFTATTTASQS